MFWDGDPYGDVLSLDGTIFSQNTADAIADTRVR